MKGFFKKLILASVLMFLFLLPCFGGGAQESDQVVLKVIAEMHNPTLALEKQLPEFEKLTGIKVELEYGPMDSVVQKELLALQAGTAEYDVISAPFQFIGSFVENDYILDIDDMMADPQNAIAGFNADNMVKGMWDVAANWKGSYYGVPSNTCIQILAYRKDLFKDPAEASAFKAKYGYELEVPDNWKAYKDIAEFFTRSKGEKLAGEVLSQDFYGITFSGKRHDAAVCDWQSIAWSFGGGTFNDSGDLVIDSPENVKALSYIKSLIPFAPPGISINTWDEKTTQFQQGLVAMTIIFNDCAPAIEDIENSRSAGKMGYAVVPVEQKSIGGNYGAWAFYIPKDAKNPEASWKFLQWVSTPEVQRNIVTEGGGFPTLQSLYKDEEFKSSIPYWEGSYEAYQICSSKPRIPEWNEINNVIMLHLSRVYNDEVAPEEALSSMRKEINVIMEGKLPISYK